MNFNPNDYNELTVSEAPIPGFYVVKLPVHGDNRGWFKENYQKEKMEALGLPAFEVVQNNFSFNDKRGATRGLHAEPWEKFISVANGSVFGAWVDLRAGPSFGTTFSIEINPGVAVFVPRGVANGYQTLEDNVTYTYLVNAHWSPEAEYTFVNLFDPALGIDWPISKDQAIISDKDAAHPLLAEIKPIDSPTNTGSTS
ncbi:MAG: dTDP-4-dehydrorhamnose 3,5-epimerase [Candidatus Saccharimonas sp.]